MLRQILKEALQPQRKEYTQKTTTDKDQIKTYAKIAATPAAGSVPQYQILVKSCWKNI
jgi:hypothetical protein